MRAQLEREKQLLLERKQAELEEARRKQEELERILEDNRLKVRASQHGHGCVGYGCATA